MIIDGRFELLDRLGSGGMGAVWRARDVVLEREVALKEVQLAGADTGPQDPDTARRMRERVLREARALARVEHPNVVTIYHIVDSPDLPHPWLVMELVRGQSLHERLVDGPLPPAQVAQIGRGVLGALRAAHAAGICHRDVKPANVLLRMDGSPVLTDFGIAAQEELSRVTHTGGLVGSPEYIAPERLHGIEGNPASDLWSLGMLMYVAVEGQSPMRRPTPAATLAAVVSAEVPTPRQAGPLTPALQALLVADPALRPGPEYLDHMLAQAAATPSAIGAMPAAPTTMPPPPFGTMPPAFGTMPPAFGTVPPAPGTMPVTGRQKISASAVLVAIGLGVTVAILATLVVFLPKLINGTGSTAGGPTGDPRGTSTPGGRSTAAGDTPATTGGAQATTLLTPSEIRRVIGLFEQASHSTKFAGMTVYPDRATVDAPVAGRSGAFDEYTYELGADAAVREGPSVGITTGDAKVSLRAFKWDALPGLLQRAARVLKVPKPKYRYVIIDPAWAFNGDQPTMMIHFVDDYDGGYLAIDTKGRVIKTIPAGS